MSPEVRRLRVDVVVMGDGPAGIEAACEAARSGRRVLLVGEGPLGGRATHASLLPSKVLIHAATERRARGERGRATDEEVRAIASEIVRIAEHQRARAAERLSDVGVDVVVGTARFESADRIEILREGSVSHLVAFERAIVAVGSVPWFPEGFFGEASRPDGVRIVAPRFVRDLSSLPETMLVVGGGVSGAEAVSAFEMLGVRVTWILDELGILPRFDRQLAASLGDALMERGVKIVHGKRVTSVTYDPAQGVLAKLDGGRTYAAERAFVAVGRRADVARLRPERAGLVVDSRSGALVVDAFGRTNVLGIYAAGDAAGPPFTANKARAQAFSAARHAVGLAVDPTRADTWIEAVYTHPEIARVGVTPEEAARRSRPFRLRSASYERSLRGVLEGVVVDPHARGLVHVVVSEDGTVEGATAIGPRAAEVLAPIAVAVQLGANEASLVGLYLAEPSLAALALDALR